MLMASLYPADCASQRQQRRAAGGETSSPRSRHFTDDWCRLSSRFKSGIVHSCSWQTSTIPFVGVSAGRTVFRTKTIPPATAHHLRFSACSSLAGLRVSSQMDSGPQSTSMHPENRTFFLGGVR